MSPVFLLTLRQLSGKWRVVIMTTLAALPVFFTAMSVRAVDAPSVSEFEIIVLSTMLAGSIAPLIIVAIASVAFANEIEERTLANLTLSPIPRWQIVLPKLAASVVVAGPFIVGSAVLTSFLAFNHDALAIFAVATGILVGLLMYASVFVWLGLVTKQAIGVGLLYIVLWEGFFSGFVSGIRFFSIRHYSIALMHGLDPRRFAESQPVGLPTTIAVSVAVVVLFLVLSTRRLRNMDVP
ncbi:MAG: ABC transporter permease subunit [Gemmatimonadetes bacterium]|nr:ABC transporter permease subunit [Gemmatimonadota bacterium]